MEMYETKLNEAANLTVKRDEYPKATSTIEGEIAAVVKQIGDLVGEKVARPGTKIEYLNLIAQLRAQRDDLVAENDRIIAENLAARKTVDDKYTAAIADFISDPQNIAKAQREAEIDRLIQEKTLLYALDGLVASGIVTDSERTVRLSKI
jgi:hypothetical protein